MTTEDPTPRRRASDLVPDIKPKISPHSIDVANDIKRNLRILIGFTVFLYLAIGGLVWWVYTQGRDNTHSLCAIRAEAQNRVSEGNKFLLQHPDGAFGFTAQDIRSSIDDSLSTVQALDNLNC